MRRFWMMVLVLCTLLLAACGSGVVNTKAASVTITVANSSLNVGQVTTLTCTALDNKGNLILNQTATLYSSDPRFVTVETSISCANTGVLAICAGTWDNPVTPSACTPGTVSLGGNPPGVGSATVFAALSTTAGITSPALTINTHVPVSRITVTPGSVNCASAGTAATTPLTAVALNSANADITSSVGAFAWSSSVPGVATVDNNGNVTALQPGVTNITAALNPNGNPVQSTPVVFTVCPVTNISLQSTTGASFSAAPGATTTLTTVATDSHGTPVPAPLLLYNTSNPASFTISAGTATSVAPGVAGLVASCSPPTCNFSLGSVYSNLVSATAPGTANATTVYVASGSSTSLLPISTSTNTVGTAITLPATPNSMLISPTGGIVYLGSSAMLMAYTISTNTVSTVTTATGKVLAISPDNTQLLMSDTVKGQVFIYNITSGSVTVFNLLNVTAGAFAVDSSRAFVLAGTSMYSIASNSSNIKTGLTTAANDVAILASGNLAYLAGGGSSGSSVAALATFNTAANCAPIDNIGTTAAPTLVGSLPNAAQVLAVDSPNIEAITPASVTPAFTTGCQPSLAPETPSTHNFGAGSFTANQLLVLPNSTQAYVTSSLPGVLLNYNVASGSAASISLAGGAAVTGTTTAAATLDSATVYVGTQGDDDLHVINTANNSDTHQISIGFSPDFVAIFPL